MSAVAIAGALQDAVEGSTTSSWHAWPALAGSSLQRLIPAPAVMLVSEDAEVADRRTFDVEGPAVPAWRARVLREVAAEHPMVRSYQGPHTSETPRRMSDILSQRAFERTSTYERLFRPAGMRYQMTIVTRGPIGKRGRSWVLNRDDRDFSDAELDTAKRLQPLLILLDDAARRLDDRALLPADRCVASADRLRLSRRELEVLRLLARGCKAQQIARLLEISPRTVRKHLENTYAKLGCSDRLLAVERARRAGLLD